MGNRGPFGDPSEGQYSPLRPSTALILCLSLWPVQLLIHLKATEFLYFQLANQEPPCCYGDLGG